MNTSIQTATRNGVTLEFSTGYARVEDYIATLHSNLHMLQNNPRIRTPQLIARYQHDIAQAALFSA